MLRNKGRISGSTTTFGRRRTISSSTPPLRYHFSLVSGGLNWHSDCPMISRLSFQWKTIPKQEVRRQARETNIQPFRLLPLAQSGQVGESVQAHECEFSLEPSADGCFLSISRDQRSSSQESGVFNYPGGVPTSMNGNSSEQWDFPNGERMSSTGVQQFSHIGFSSRRPQRQRQNCEMRLRIIFCSF